LRQGVKKMEKLIISVGVTGSRVVPVQTPYMKITPKEIADDAIRAAEAGAASVHIHARDPRDGKPTADTEIFREIASTIKAKSDVIICTSTGGGRWQTYEDRIKVVPALKPELASLSVGSLTGSAASQLRAYKDKDYRYPWEKEYLKEIGKEPYSNPYDVVVRFGQTMQENGTKPEYELFDVGWIYTVHYLWSNYKGFCEPPLWMQFCMGAFGGIRATPEHLIQMKQTADSLFGLGNYHWSALAAGYPMEFHLGALAIMMGGHVRVGLEDNIYIADGILAKSNAEMVEKIVRLARELDREVATPDEARKILNLKGKDKVGF
jgi:uncharacterized protein (DUF849 family)